MTRLLGMGLLATVWLVSLSVVACGGQAEAEKISVAAAGAIEMGIDPETTGNTAGTLGTLESCVRVDVPNPSFDGVSDYNIDIYVKGDTQAPVGYDASVAYDQSIVHIAAPGTDDFIKLPGATNFSNALPDSDGMFTAAAAYISGGPGTAGDGTLVRLGLDIGDSGVVTFTLDSPPRSAYASDAGGHPVTVGFARLAINRECSDVVPTPSTTPGPTPTPGTPIPATLTPTPGTPIPGTPTPTPLPGTIMLMSGWNNSCYVGHEQPIEDALTDISDRIQAVYRLSAGQDFQRWFPSRPELSTITAVGPYEALLILMSDAATWSQQLPDVPPSTLALAQGWNNVCYLGQTKSAGDAAAGVAGGFGIMYQLGSNQVWSRYVPARPDVSNIAQLSQYDTLLILVDQESGTTWTFDP